MTASKRSRIPHLLWIAGLILMVMAIFFFAHHGIPYQDATPEQLAIQQAGLKRFEITFSAGFFCFGAGIGSLIWQAVRRKRKSS